MSEFGEVEQPHINPNSAEVRQGINVEEPECQDETLNEWLDVTNLELAIAHARHLKDITPHFRADPAFRSCRYILQDWEEFFEALLDLHVGEDLTVPQELWAELKLRTIKQLLGHKETQNG